MGYGYSPLLCHICPEPCLSASPPSNWQHPAFACSLRCPWDQPPLSRPTSPSQACYHPPWLLPVSRLAAPPQVLHPTAKVQVSFQAGLCPNHLKSPSLTSNANSLTRPSEICCHYHMLLPPGELKGCALRNASLLKAAPPLLLAFPLSEVVLRFCSHFPCQGYAFHKQRGGPSQTPAI